jgi:integrase/recombinase XerC
MANTAPPTIWPERYLAHLAGERRLAPLTVHHYRRDLATFTAYCTAQGISDWAAVTVPQVRAFIATRHRASLSGRSLQRLLSTLRGFYRYLLREGQSTGNPAQAVRAPKSPRQLPGVLDVDQLAHLLDQTPQTPLEVRDHAMLELLYSSGLRLAELVALRGDAVDLADGSLRVTGKGNKVRLVPVGSQARAALQHWLPLRTGLAALDEPALFVGHRGRALTARAVQLRLLRWGRRGGADARLHPHLLRHCCASHLLESSGDLRAVQELLGHADIRTTQIYTHLDFQHLAKIYDAAHPRAKKHP